MRLRRKSVLPGAVQAERHEVVHEVVAAGDAAKDLVHKTLLLVQGNGLLTEMGGLGGHFTRLRADPAAAPACAPRSKPLNRGPDRSLPTRPASHPPPPTRKGRNHIVASPARGFFLQPAREQGSGESTEGFMRRGRRRGHCRPMRRPCGAYARNP